MEPRVRYLIVGSFVVFLSAIFVIAVIWFSDSQRKVHETYLVYMKEAAVGLSPQAPVRFMGVDVGYVDQIQLNPKNRQEVVLVLKIERGTPIDQSTTATLMAQGITGVTYVGLKASEAKAPPLQIQPGQKYPVIASRPSLLVQLDSVIREITGTIKNIGQKIDTLLDSDNLKAVRDTLAQMDKVTETLAKNSGLIQSSMKNLNESLDTGKSTLEAFKQQTLPQMSEIMRQTSSSLADIKQLTKDLKTNPSMLIRGKAPGPKGPGE